MVLLVVGGLTAFSSGQALPPGGNFVDDDSNTHEGFIEAIAGEQITSGCDLIRYCPAQAVTRAQMASFLARALALPVASQDWFPDDTGSTHEDNINRIADAGITLGLADGTFDPDGPVRRDQMASFLSRALFLLPTGEDYFTDDVGNTHELAINSVAHAGITFGCDTTGSLYCPEVDVRRDQMASFLGRGLGLVAVSVPPPVLVPVLSITDGDTIRVQVDGVSEPLRLIGIDSPESGACLSADATARITDLVAGGDIRIDVDVSHRDQFDRLLRYVFVDGRFVNEDLVRDGLAEAVRYPPDTGLAEILETAQDDAQAARVGLWDPKLDCSTTPTTIATITTTVATTTTTSPGGQCDPSYPDHCIPPPPPDLNCPDIPWTDFRALPPDPHGFDGNDNDGIGCET